MKKILAVIPIAILIILLSNDQFVLASTYTLNPDNYQNVVYITGYNNGWYNGTQLVTIVTGTDYVLSFNNGSTQNDLRLQYNAFNLVNVNIGDFTVESNVGTQSSGFVMNNVQSIVVYKGSFNFGNFTTPEQSFDNWQDYQDYINPPPEPDTWYEILWNQFTDWIDSIGDTLSEGYEDFINWLNGESTHGGGHEFTMPEVVRPSPIPTPIPYNTVIVPKTDPNTGDTYYEYNYVYNNPSGTPIITGSPPPNVDVTVNDNDFEYPYYNNPDNRNNPYYFEMPWYLKFINGTNVFDLDDMSDNLDVMETAINDDTISDGVTSAYSSMATLPTSWIQLIGIIASIPLIGCLIARFLKG